MASHCHERKQLAVEARQDESPTVDYDVRSYAVWAIVIEPARIATEG
jgi:hypothetical protein